MELTEKKEIFDYVPSGIKLRDVQIEFLRWVSNNIDNYDVFVIRMPVGSGKSICAVALSEWISKVRGLDSGIITPTKILQDQYVRDFSWIPLLKGASNYSCGLTDGASCRQMKVMTEKYCEGCACTAARNAAKVADVAIFNFHSYFSNSMYKKAMIIDESHNAQSFVFSLFGTNLWQCDFEYPDEMLMTAENIINCVSDSVDKLAPAIKEALTFNNHKLAEQLIEAKDKAESVIYLLQNNKDDVLIIPKRGTYKGNFSVKSKNTEQNYIFIKPLKINKLAERILWPNDQVDKIFLLSATINEQNIKMLGLEGRRVGYFSCKSPIPAENRPVYEWPVANMSSKNRAASLPVVSEAIKKLAERFESEKGIIHCTYQTAKILRDTLPHGGRYIFHNDMNKLEMYNFFRQSKKPLILIASGMSEGIDLPDDAARWQVITQVMYPNLGDDVNMWYCKNDYSAYLAEAVQTIEQQVGRICRHPNDKGTTIILDSQFNELFYKTHTARMAKGKNSMWSESFIDALKKKN